MIINDEFRKEFGWYLEWDREWRPENYDEHGRHKCDLLGKGCSNGSEGCTHAVVAFTWAPSELLFLCLYHTIGLHDCAKELAADAEWLNKNIPRGEYGQFDLRECQPSITWIHVAPDQWPWKPIHWGICDQHKFRWRKGQGLTEPPAECILRGEEREKFFHEYYEGHCPGFDRRVIPVVDYPGQSPLDKTAHEEDLPF